MSIDVSREHIITLAQAAREVPGKPIHVSTIHRWRMKGCRGVRLDVILRGGVAYTSREALGRFFTAVTEAAERTDIPRKSVDRSAAMEAAERELSSSGF